jgi:hypothetical protein
VTHGSLGGRAEMSVLPGFSGDTVGLSAAGRPHFRSLAHVHLCCGAGRLAAYLPSSGARHAVGVLFVMTIALPVFSAVSLRPPLGRIVPGVPDNAVQETKAAGNSWL